MEVQDLTVPGRGGGFGRRPPTITSSCVASSAKVIAAAAIIMLSMFGSFILNGDPTIKQFGVGLVASTLAVQTAPARRHRGRDGTARPGTGPPAATPGDGSVRGDRPLED